MEDRDTVKSLGITAGVFVALTLFLVLVANLVG